MGLPWGVPPLYGLGLFILRLNSNVLYTGGVVTTPRVGRGSNGSSGGSGKGVD